MSSTIGEEFTLCNGGGEVLGVSQGPGEGQVLVSFSVGTVQLHDVHESRPLYGWQLPHSEVLLCPAVGTPNRHYWAVNSKMDLLHWTEETTPTVSRQLRSKAVPARLLVVCGDVPLVVYRNGDVEGVAGGSMASLCPSDGVGKWEVVEAAVWEQEVGVVSIRKRSVAVGIATPTMDTEGVVLMQVCVGVVKRKIDYQSCCMCGDQLWMLSNQGQLLQMDLCRPVGSLQIMHTVTSPPESASLLALSPDFFILGHAHQLQLWDTRYCTCHCIRTIACGGSKFWCVEGCVWGGATGLLGWRVQMGVANLAASLGRRQHSHLETPTTMLLSWPTSNKQLVGNWSDEPAESAAVLADLCDPDKATTLSAFLKLFASVSLDETLCWRGVAERLLGETQFWAREPLIQLLKAGLVDSDVDVVGVAFAKEDWALMRVCLKCGITPTETCLVKTLLQALSLPDSVESYGVNLEKKDILLDLLSVPFTDVLLQRAAAAMPLVQVKELLTFLCQSVGVVSLLAPPTPSYYPYDNLLLWMGVLLDVHFTSLLLDTSCRGLLLDLRACVLSQMRCYDYLCSLFTLQQKHVPSKPHPHDWLWKEEELVFSYD